MSVTQGCITRIGGGLRERNDGRWGRWGDLAGVVPVKEEVGASKGFDAILFFPGGGDDEPEFPEGTGEGVI